MSRFLLSMIAVSFCLLTVHSAANAGEVINFAGKKCSVLATQPNGNRLLRGNWLNFPKPFWIDGNGNFLCQASYEVDPSAIYGGSGSKEQVINADIEMPSTPATTSSSVIAI